MRWIHPVTADVDAGADLLGGKAHGLITLRRLGLPVPPGFVITTQACREFLQNGRLPDGLIDELTQTVAELEAATHRTFGGHARPLVSVRSGSTVSMPGMMSTILNLDLTVDHLIPAVTEVFSSWNNRRARTYRELHDIPHELGTAVTVQAMVFGDHDEQSGSGVVFSRDPNTGQPIPFGEVLFGRQGDEVVSGRSLTLPLHDLADREPDVWSALLRAMEVVENDYRDTCYVEFTFEAGELWLLQVRPGGLTGTAAIRAATDFVDEGLIERAEALLRVSSRHLQFTRTPRIAMSEKVDPLARGQGACPGVAVGRVATTADTAVRMAADGPVVLARPETSPLDMHGIGAASGLVTARGGPASHAAVVARSMGKPAVVGAADLTITDTEVRAGGLTVGEGTLIAIDGLSGDVVVGQPEIVTDANDPHVHRLLAWADEVSADTSERPEAERLTAAHSALRTPATDGTQ